MSLPKRILWRREGGIMADVDFEPEGWSAFDDHGAHGEKGNAGCAFAILAVVIIATIGKLAGC